MDDTDAEKQATTEAAAELPWDDWPTAPEPDYRRYRPSFGLRLFIALSNLARVVRFPVGALVGGYLAHKGWSAGT